MFGMKKLSFILLFVLSSLSWGQSAGFNNTFAVLSLNNGANTYYDLNASTANQDFNNATLGNFNPAFNTLVLNGAEHNVWKCGGCDLTSTRLYYRIYLTSNIGGAFSSINLPWASGFNNGCGGQDQVWSITNSNVNLLSGLSAGTYYLELYSDASITCSGGTAYASNGGANYKATFTVTPDEISLNNIGQTYLTDFNSLSIGASSTVLPQGWRILESGANANSTYSVGTGSSSTGDTYSFGVAGNSDRSLGSLRSGSVTPSFGAKFLNNTAQTVSSMTINYVGETWRCGTAGRQDRLDFQYSTDATSLNSGTWTHADSLDYYNLAFAATASGSVLHTANRNYTISGLNIAPGTYFWIRWTDFDAAGSDDGMAIDDFSIKPCFTVGNPTTSAQAFCGAASVSNLTATGSNLTWYSAASGGGALASNTALASATYYVSQTVSNCESGRATSAVTIHSLPNVTAGSNQSICEGAAVTLSGAGASSYTWNNGVSNGVAFTPASTQTYTVTGLDANNCTNTAQVTVSVNATIDWCNIQWPSSGSINCGGALAVYGKVYDAAYTPAAGASASIDVQVGVYTANTDPATWPANAWTNASFNVQTVNDDEYMANIGANLPQGTYYYSFRYGLNGGTCYKYGGFQGGFWNGSSNVNGVLTVNGLDWANLQSPGSGSICQGGTFTVYGQAYKANVTNAAGATAGLTAQIGVSSANTNPATWPANAWSNANFNVQVGNNDEFTGTLSGLAPGTHYYAFRYKLANSCNYEYGGFNAGGGGFWNGSTHQNGTLTVHASPSANAGGDITGPSTCGKNSVSLAASAIGASETGAWNLVSGNNANVSFNNAAVNNATFSGNYGASYVLEWTVTNNQSNCSASDQVAVTFNQPNAAAVAAQLQNGDLLWAGLNSSDWSDGTNWYAYSVNGGVGTFVQQNAGGQPVASSQVFTMNIANGGFCIGTNNIDLSGGSNAEDVYVGPGITWNLTSQTVNIAQNLTNNGTIIASTGTVNFTGASNSTISGSGNTQLFDMTVNKSQGATLTLQQPVLVTNTLTMTQGNVFTNNNNLLTLGTSSAAPGTLSYNTGTIVGPFKRYFTNAATNGNEGLFPVGTSTYNRYASFSFGSTPGVDQFLTVEYVTGAPMQGGSPLYNGLPCIASGALVQNYSADGYWSVVPTSNNYTAPITTAPYSVTLFANNLTGMQTPQICRIIKSAGSNNAAQHHVAWQGCGTHTAINAGVSPQAFAITSTAVQGFSWFNIGTSNNQALPVELVSFNGSCESEEVKLTWQTATEHNSSYYEVEKSRDGMEWQVLTTVTAAGNSTQLLNYETMDAHAMEGNNYYRLTQVDIDGTRKTYDAINVSCSGSTKGYFSAYPNPSTGAFQVNVSGRSFKGLSYLKMWDTHGVILLNRSIEVKPGINMFNVSDLNLAPGVYYLQIVNGERTTEVLKEVIR
jgi:hypothetical protein